MGDYNGEGGEERFSGISRTIHRFIALPGESGASPETSQQVHQHGYGIEELQEVHNGGICVGGAGEEHHDALTSTWHDDGFEQPAQPY